MGFRKTIKILYSYIRPYRWRVIFGIFSLLVVDLLNVLPPLVLKKFIDQAEITFAGNKEYKPYFILGTMYIGIALIQGIFRYFWRICLVKSSHRAAESIREQYFSKLQKLPPSFFDRYPIGDLMALATNDVEAIRFALGPGLLVFADAIFLFIAMPPMMYYLSPKLSFYTLLPMLFIPVFIIWAEKQVHDRFEKVQEQFSKLTAYAQENIEGIRIIKAFVREWSQLKRFSNLGKEFVKLNLKLAKVQIIFEPVFMLSLAMGFCFLLLFAGPMVLKGELAVGTFVAFTRYLDQLVWPLSAFGLAVTYFQRGKSSLTRILEVLAETEEVDVLKKDVPKNLKEKLQSFDKSTGDSMLVIRNLNFSYPDGTVALKNININIEFGSWTCLLGPVGSGKTTLIKLLTGLYPLPKNSVFWQGVDLTLIPLKERRNLFSWVPQEVLLFSDTVGRNVFLGDKKSETIEDLIETAEIQQSFRSTLNRAGIESEKRQFSFHNEVGERGSNLSGGEKARVTLARALVREAPMLILDDVLSSVDTETESKILDGILKSQNKKQTLLLITHRILRINEFDKVYVFHKGECIQSGDPSQLSNENGMFKKLLELQNMEDSLV